MMTNLVTGILSQDSKVLLMDVLACLFVMTGMYGTLFMPGRPACRKKDVPRGTEQKRGAQVAPTSASGNLPKRLSFFRCAHVGFASCITVLLTGIVLKGTDTVLGYLSFVGGQLVFNGDARILVSTGLIALTVPLWLWLSMASWSGLKRYVAEIVRTETGVEKR
jgi:hypothetical protein